MKSIYDHINAQHEQIQSDLNHVEHDLVALREDADTYAKLESIIKAIAYGKGISMQDVTAEQVLDYISRYQQDLLQWFQNEINFREEK